MSIHCLAYARAIDDSDFGVGRCELLSGEYRLVWWPCVLPHGLLETANSCSRAERLESHA